MADVPIPDGVIGCPGMVARLHHMRTDGEGRLVVVRQPTGFLSTMVGLDKPSFCWLVRVLGPMPLIKGQPSRDIYVPDRCLLPAGSMSDEDLGVLIQSQGVNDFAKALQDLREVIGATTMPINEFERFVERAGKQIALDKALEVVQVPVALREIGFVPPTVDSDTLVWAGVHGGMELRFQAGMNYWFGWQIVATGNSAHTAVWDERNLPAVAPRGEIVRTVLDMWRTSFNERPSVPDALALGATYEAHKLLLRRTGVTLPTLRPHPVAFRAIRKWLLQAGPTGLPAGDETWIELRQDGAMLRFELDGIPFGCPADGLWVEAREVRFSDFAAVPASVLRSQWLALVQDGGSILVNEWRLPSRVPAR